MTTQSLSARSERIDAERQNHPALDPLVRAQDLARVHRIGPLDVHALQGVSLEVDPDTFVALRGRSGSGKTTLLRCIAALDRPTTGCVWLNRHEVTGMPERKRVRLRRERIGFVSQSVALLPNYSAWENEDLMLRLVGVRCCERR